MRKRVLMSLVLLAIVATSVVFGQSSKYSAYQSQIQRACNFSNPADVWAAIEKHSNPEGVYQKLASALSGTPTTEDYKEVIQALCKFGKPATDIWPVFNYRVLAQSMVGERQR